MKALLPQKNTDLFITLVIYLVFVLGFFFPEKLWGVHFTAFLSHGVAFILLAVPLLLIIGAACSKSSPNLKIQHLKPSAWQVFTVLIPILAAALFYYFPIPNDFYGNARNFYFTKETVISQLPPNTLKELIHFEFIPGQGRKGVKIIVDLISFYTEQTLQQSFILLNTVFGGLYVFLLLNFISTHIQSIQNRIIVSIVFLTSPLFLVYFGHIETYAPVFFLLLCWFLLYVKATRSNRKVELIPLFIVWLIGLRFHTFFILLMPAFGILAGNLYFPNLTKKVTPLKKTFLFVYLPLLTLGLIAYFFIFKDYNDPRKLTNFEDIDRLFLPLISPAAPLNNYNLIGINHGLDFINLILFWSPAFIFLFFTIFSFRKKINWNSLEVSGLSLTLLIFCTFLFAVNPLLSMPMDWDLFMFPVTGFIVLSVILFQKIEHSFFTKKRIFLLVSTSLLCIPAFITTLSSTPNSYRVESIGKHIYKTYYEHASTYLLFAISESDSKEEYETRLTKAIKELEPLALLGNDKQYADLLIDYSMVCSNGSPEKARKVFLSATDYFLPDSKYDKHINTTNEKLIKKGYVFSKEDLNKGNDLLKKGNSIKAANLIGAIENFRSAFFYNPISTKINLALLEVYYETENFQAAYQQAIYLKNKEGLSIKKKLRILIHTSLEANEYAAADQHCVEYLAAFPDDSLIRDIFHALQANDEVEQLKYNFRRK